MLKKSKFNATSRKSTLSTNLILAGCLFLATARNRDTLTLEHPAVMPRLLPSAGEALDMAYSSVALNFLQSLNCSCIELPKLAPDHVFRDFIPESSEFFLRKVFGHLVWHVEVEEDLAGMGATYAMDALKGDLHPLVVGDLNSPHTSGRNIQALKVDSAEFGQRMRRVSSFSEDAEGTTDRHRHCLRNFLLFLTSIPLLCCLAGNRHFPRRESCHMSFFDTSFLNSELSKSTSIFGLRLWVVIGICVGAFIVFILFLLSLCLTSRRRTSSHHLHPKLSAGADPTPVVSKEIQEIVHVAAPDQRGPVQAVPEIQIDIGKAEHRIVFSDRPSSQASGESRSTTATDSMSLAVGPPEVSHLGWGHWYTLRELEDATGGLVDENVIGEGGYGIVYRGVLPDNTQVAVKNLLNNRGQAEREFKVEVEAIGRVRHKNLVRLLGYCVEGAYRMLVYEYVDNGNLDQWLHGDAEQFRPLTWDMRMNIILGTAKGLAYLHEGLEPKVVHRDVKASNILLDRQWNAKVSDFGLAKLLCSERSYVTTRVMGTFGYVAPEYASTGMLTERSDVYSFGVLIMEIISGRSPVDYSRPPGEVHLVEWLKTMVGNRTSEQVLDPRIPEKPSSKALKRALLVALRCVDPDAQKRPKMGHVIHMLEMDDLLFREDRQMGREASHSRREYGQAHDNHVAKLTDKQLVETSDTSQREKGNKQDHQTRWR